MAQDAFNIRDDITLSQRPFQFPRRFPLLATPENRESSTAKDSRLVNCFVEVDKNTKEYWVRGRPGIATSLTSTGLGFGCYNWNGDVYSIFGSTVLKNGASMGAVVDTTNGVYKFDQSLNPSLLLFGNGVKGYTTDGTTVTQITDVDFPTLFVKGWAFLDATNYVMVGATAAIQGSDINGPTLWDPLNKIIAQIEPDLGVALAKQLVYAVALKQWSTEVFYDAGNATGSPLGRVQGAKANFGCISADSVQELDGMLLWASTYRKGNQSSTVTQVVIMDSVKVREVSTPAVERLLEGADFSVVFSWTLKMEGHRFYVLTLKNSNLTLAYDLDENWWWQWTDSAGNYFPIVASTSGVSGQTHLLQHESNGKLYSCMPSLYNDDGAIISKDIYTPNFDGGIRRRKLLSRLEFVGDITAGSTLRVRCNDEDYNPAKWTNFRTVDLSKDRPYLDDCGSFYRRAYHLNHNSNTPFRISALEMQLAIGAL